MADHCICERMNEAEEFFYPKDNLKESWKKCEICGGKVLENNTVYGPGHLKCKDSMLKAMIHIDKIEFYTLIESLGSHLNTFDKEELVRRYTFFREHLIND